jgi:hypothetical protein
VGASNHQVARLAEGALKVFVLARNAGRCSGVEPLSRARRRVAYLRTIATVPP